MDWFFDRRNKSIATSAQKVVSDLHTELDKQASTIKELERVIFKFKNMCTDSIERDINRLEARKRELISELESTDEEILIAQERLRAAKEEVANVLLPNNQKLTNGQYHQTTTSLDEQFLEEGELLSFLRTELGEFLFIIHLSTANDIYVYSFSENQSELVSVAKISDIAHPTRLSGLTPYEKVMAYGIKLIPGDDRDYPDIYEVPLPASLLLANSDQVAPEAQRPVGSLVGAFEIPLLPGVVIDVWRETTAPFRVWASTPVDGIGFSVLERVHLELSEVTSSSNADSDLQTPVQAEIFGRHPSKGALLMERVKSEE